VLHHWTGLGYYARARNLHKAAITVHEKLGGEFPQSVDELEQLPGIGRSTAGAIHSIANRQYAVILDGNVKRVLSRLHCVDGWYGKSSVAKVLWELAEQYTPCERTADYTQAIMDLGATLCTRSRPACERCPVSDYCMALKQDKVSAYPQGKPKKKLPVKQTQMLLLQNSEGEIWLYKRPSQGIWGGLWSLPEIEVDNDASSYCESELQMRVLSIENLEGWRHTFSHYHLDIQPVLLTVETSDEMLMEPQNKLWYNSAQPAAIGLAAPVKRLLETLHKREENA
jgi:A/G-specific adenine glycosylase